MSPAKQPFSPSSQAEDNVLAVITDESNGREYYVSVIDVFEFRNREYGVMYHYQADLNRKGEPEIVLMRSYRGEDGSRYFCSIRNPQELELVFELFFQRYQEAQKELQNGSAQAR